MSELPSPPKDLDAVKYVIGGKRKRRRRATHGKISFSCLAKLIGEKWKTIDDEQREYYEQLAVVDLQRYHDEMDLFNAKSNDKEKPTTPTSVKKAQAKNDDDEELIESHDDDNSDDMENAVDVATKNI